MLFDLRSRGRRNLVKVVYSMLAVLMGAGLILFGIGGATSGGFLNSLTGGGGGGGSSNSPQKAEKHLEQIVRREPQNAAAWLRLANIRYNIAIANASTQGTAAQPSKSDLAPVDAAWTRYLALNPPKPSASFAQIMEGVYLPAGLNDPAKLVAAIEVNLGAKKAPTVTDYELYSVAATQAGQTRKAGLAQQKAQQLAAAGKAGKARKQAIAQVKTAITAAQAQFGGGAPPTAQTVGG